MAERRGPSRAGRVFRGLLSLVIVAAAGFGGWFVYEQVVAPDEAGSTTAPGTAEPAAVAAAEAAADRPANPPWPADVVLPTSSWGSFRTSFHPEGDIIRQQVDYDAATRQAKMTLFDPEGGVVLKVEVRGRDIWFDQLEGAGWEEAPRDADGMAVATFDHTQPEALAQLFPPSVWPYVALESDGPVPDAPGRRRLGFAIDLPAFSLAEPMAAAEWRQQVGHGFGFEPARLTVDLDPAGHVVRSTSEGTGAGVVAHFAELTEPVVFESPLGR